MSFSMFARSSVYRCGTLSRQMVRSTIQPSMMHRTISSSLPASTCFPLSGVLSNNSTPILNAVRSIWTTPALRSEHEHSHDHTKLWVIERWTAAILAPLLPLALMFPSKILDTALAILVCAHSFWGLEAIAVDYVRASIFGPLIPKLAIGLVYAITIVTLGGLLYIIFNDIGIANTIRNIWAIKPREQKA